MEPVDIVRAATRAHAAGNATGFRIEVFNDEEADVVIRGLAKTGVLYDLVVRSSRRSEGEVDAMRADLERDRT